MKFIRGVLLLVNIVCLILLILSYLSPYVHPHTFSLPSLCGLIYPWIFLMNVFFVIFWLIFEPMYTLWSFLGLIMGLSFINNFIGTSFQKSTNNPDFIVGTFNMQTAIKSLANHKKDQDDLDKEYHQFIQRLSEIDILCGQETSYRAHQIILEQLKFKYNNRVHKKESIIYSKYPIINQGTITHKNYKLNMTSWADIKINKDTLRVYSIHLITNKVTDAAQEVAEGVIDERRIHTETISNMVNLFRRYRDSAAIRAVQAKEIKEHMESSPYRIIACGDFNDTPQSYVYSLLSENLKDSFKHRGKGLGTTFAGIIPALRIDYILAGQAFKITDHIIIKDQYSDHYPIQSGIQLSEL